MAVLGPFDVGDLTRVGNHFGDTARAAFKNAAAVDTDPTAVTLRIRKPDGTLLVYGWPTAGVSGSLTREAGRTGRFYIDYTWGMAGHYGCELKGTGAIESMDQWQVFVRSSVVV